MKASRTLLLALIALALLVLWIMLAPVRASAADAPCGPYEQALVKLAESYQEVPRGRGLASGGFVVVVLRDEPGDTWTILGVRPDGVACILAAGTGWEDLAAPAAGQEG